MINTPKYPLTHKDRHLVGQEEVVGPVHVIVDRANMLPKKKFTSLPRGPFSTIWPRFATCIRTGIGYDFQ